MTKDDREIMAKLRSALIAKVGSQVYDLWFERVAFRTMKGGLEVLAPDPFTLDRLRHKLRPVVEETCIAILGAGTRVSYAQAPAATASKSSHKTSSSSAEPASREGKPMPSSLRPPSSRPQLRVSPASVASVPAPTPTAVSRTPDVASGDELPRRRSKTFEQFVAGEGNQLALAAARGVVPRLGIASPLLLYGPHGCGKTHLLESVMSEARRDRRIRRTVHVSAEQFTTQFLEALQGSGLPSFRRKYRDLDLLVVDDIQFLGGKKATLVEFQHTLDGLQRSGRQIVLSADRPPSDLAGLGAEIIARISGGLVCGLEPPDEAVRRGILRRAAQQLELKLSSSIVEYLADALPADARQLHGALHRLDATHRATGTALTLPVVQRAVVDLVHGGQGLVRLPDIERAVCQVFGLDSKRLQSDSKSRAVSQPRMLAMWLARKYTRAGLAEIGQYFGRRSHSTVIAAQRKMDEMLNQRAVVRLQLSDCSIQDALRRVEGRLRTG